MTEQSRAGDPSATAKDKDPRGGLSAAGRKKFGVKKGVGSFASAGDSDKKRWVRWALRFTKTPRPLTDDKGQPTRYALMFRAWGEPVPTSVSAVKAVHSKAIARAKQLGMGQYEKAEQPLFEHEWESTDGRPEATSCAVCGVNSYSDEHVEGARLAQAERAESIARTHARVAVQRLDDSTYQRLLRQYGPQVAARRVDAVQTAPQGLPPMPPTGPAEEHVDGPTPRQVESQAIAENSRTPEAGGPHPFMQAEFPDDQDQPRCRLCGGDEPSHKEFLPEIPIAAAATVTARSEAPVVKEGQALPLPDESIKAFLTEVNGRTLLTAPANVFTSETEKALHANKHFLWMQGRFVGAEKANRNGAFWKTEDLELGELTVRHGPLNWLHEARHVIGTIASTQLITREQAADRDVEQPYIQAASAIWRWIYPDEAWVVEQASDAQKLWYSMECISEEVACVGDNGCGAKASYGDYMQGKGGTCAHMVEKSATRHFANPTFLGGAVIVPPVRPGWAEADATVMRQAAGLAEHAFEQAGKPDVAASEWEQLMAQVVRFSGAS